ncbi:MAG: YdcF family protein [Hyphomicrobiales bacterium]|nr:YdcF family protein [Hyphomicrobiales bacterium]MCP5371051.1 YdcF family protein [Hyphomicrobiales bacterium]
MRYRQARNWPARLFVVLLAALAAWGVGLYRFGEGLPQAVGDPDSPTDAVVVLTGGSGRLEAGLELLEAGKAGAMFVSGVYQGTDVRRLLHLPQPADGAAKRLEIGNAADTTGNARETAAWMARRGFTSLRLVTGAYHMPRSLLEFRAALPRAAIVPHPVFPRHVKHDRWWAWPGTLSLIAGEYSKYLIAWIRIRLAAMLTPRPRP